jgi:hypothetical protein
VAWSNSRASAGEWCLDRTAPVVDEHFPRNGLYVVEGGLGDRSGVGLLALDGSPTGRCR